jgi:hypothetical protein
MKKYLLFIIPLLLISGCATDLYVRDIQSKPVANATVDVEYFSIGGTFPEIPTDNDGYVDISNFPLTVESIRVSKDGYKTVTLQNLGNPPYIVILLPEEKDEKDNEATPLDRNSALRKSGK